MNITTMNHRRLKVNRLIDSKKSLIFHSFLANFELPFVHEGYQGFIKLSNVLFIQGVLHKAPIGL